jgi:hypothetical protein
VTTVAGRFANRRWHSVAQLTPRDVGHGVLRGAGRLTNPDRLSRWVLQRLETLPDVAEIV